MKSTCLPDLYYASVYQADRRIDFNGFLWKRPEGNVLFDPMPLTPDQLEFVREQGGARWILVSSVEHLRAAPELSELLGAEIVAPESERTRLGELASVVSHWFDGRDTLPGGLGAELAVHWLGGGKSEAEPVFVIEPMRAAIFGDLVRSHESGRLRLLPDPKLSDRERAIADVRALGVDFDAVLLGDGDCIFRDASAALRQLHADLA